MQKSKYVFQLVLLVLGILLFQASAGAFDEKVATEEVELPEDGGDPGKAYLNAWEPELTTCQKACRLVSGIEGAGTSMSLRNRIGIRIAEMNRKRTGGN